ncbi:MAG: hypothetical protein HOW73_06960 [Polyangiaceae bacterium]|nr:hypothetical protein [Polyangiaceae bacterium]
MHWTRIAIAGCSFISLIASCCPWLVHVPRGVSPYGEGTIYGFQTPHGIAVAVGAVLTAVLCYVGTREFRPHRGVLVGCIFITLAMLFTAAFVLGDDGSGMEIDGLTLGVGAVVLLMSLIPMGFVACIALILPGAPPAFHAPHANAWQVDPANPYAPPRWDQGPPRY